jgi:hypothetical protein
LKARKKFLGDLGDFGDAVVWVRTVFWASVKTLMMNTFFQLMYMYEKPLDSLDYIFEVSADAWQALHRRLLNDVRDPGKERGDSEP